MSLVAGALQKAGHTFFQLDMMRLGQKEILARVKAEPPDYIGLSVRNIDNVDSFTADEASHLSEIRTLVESLKRLNPAPMIPGEAGFSIIPHEILDYCGADFGVQGARE